MQSYVLAGEFTFIEKFRSALKENIIFYVVAGVVLLILVVYILAQGNLGL
jgi:hypothetical protein